jgi:CRP-like cAMP-binding protein
MADLYGPWCAGILLDRLDDAGRRELLALGAPRRFGPGDVMLAYRDTGVALLRSGFAKMKSDWGQLLRIRGAGDLVGRAALPPRGGPITAFACGVVHARVIDGAEWRRFIRRHPPAITSRASPSPIADWWSDLQYEAGGPMKLALVLHELMEAYGRAGPSGEISFGVPITQRELASMMNQTEATANRAIAALRARGTIRTERRSVTITDGPGLQQWFAFNPFR